MPGFFLTLDGIDGTGKSTQCRRLADWLRSTGRTVTTCVDPGGTDLGAKLREILLKSETTPICPRAEAMLFMASRAELIDEIIRPALGRSEIVLCDRFLLSTVVYQGHAGGLAPADIWHVGDVATGGLRPDLTLVLDLKVEAAIARRGRAADRMEARGIEYAEKVRAGFLAEAAADPNRHVVIDAGGDADAVHAAIRNALSPRLPGGR